MSIASQGIPPFYETPGSLPLSPPPFPILSQINPVHALPSHCLQISLNIIHTEDTKIFGATIQKLDARDLCIPDVHYVIYLKYNFKICKFLAQYSRNQALKLLFSARLYSAVQLLFHLYNQPSECYIHFAQSSTQTNNRHYLKRCNLFVSQLCLTRHLLGLTHNCITTHHY